MLGDVESWAGLNGTSPRWLSASRGLQPHHSGQYPWDHIKFLSLWSHLPPFPSDVTPVITFRVQQVERDNLPTPGLPT